MLLLHRPFIEFSSQSNHANAGIIHGSVDLDALAADSRQACENAASNISVIVRQKQSLMSDPDSYSPLCLPTCFVYSMFQSSLIHLAIAIKNRDSLRRLRLLQRSIALLKQHQMLNSGKRAHNILVMLVAINGINIDNLLDHTKEEDNTPGLLTEDGLSHSSPPRNGNKELQFSYRNNQTSVALPQQQQIQEQQIQPTAIIPSCEDNMPKSSWYQRMMNTSIVGGITADLHQGMSETNSSSSLEQLLPYNHHPMSGQAHHHHGHSRSDSNATLYHQPEADMHQPPYCCSYYDINQPNLNNTTKRMDLYNDNHLFEEAGGNMRLIQTDNYHAPPTTTTTTTTATVPSHTSFTHRNSAPLPFTQTTATPLPPTNGSPVPNTAHYSTVNYLPPSNYNWNDWGVYISHQSIPPPTNNTTSPEHHHLTR